MYKKTAKIFAKFSPLATAVRALTASLRCNCALDLRRIPLLTLIIVTFSALCCVCLLVFFFDEFHFLPSFDLIDAVKLFVTAFMPMFFLLISAMAWFYRLRWFVRLFVSFAINLSWAYVVGAFYSPVATLRLRLSGTPYDGASFHSGLVAGGERWRWVRKWTDSELLNAIQTRTQVVAAEADLSPEKTASLVHFLNKNMLEILRVWKAGGSAEANQLYHSLANTQLGLLRAPGPTFTSFLRGITRPLYDYCPALSQWMEANPTTSELILFGAVGAGLSAAFYGLSFFLAYLGPVADRIDATNSRVFFDSVRVRELSGTVWPSWHRGERPAPAWEGQRVLFLDGVPAALLNPAPPLGGAPNVLAPLPNGQAAAIDLMGLELPV
jgi:hypothetical protein